MNMLGLFPVLVLGAGLILNAATSTVPEAQAQVQPADDEIPADIIAVQIRKQGYACDKPESAKRDPQVSRPDMPVWILKCESGSYRVRLVGNMADRVEKL
jgi:hypothetical protein